MWQTFHTNCNRRKVYHTKNRLILTSLTHLSMCSMIFVTCSFMKAPIPVLAVPSSIVTSKAKIQTQGVDLRSLKQVCARTVAHCCHQGTHPLQFSHSCSTCMRMILQIVLGNQLKNIRWKLCSHIAFCFFAVFWLSHNHIWDVQLCSRDTICFTNHILVQ